jgi:hypothetical protein
MQSLSSIAVINGRAALWGDAIPALILKAGHHLDVRLEGEGDAAVAIAVLTRRDTRQMIERRFSMEDTKRAGFLSKAGPWRDYPTRMLMMRTRSWAARDGTADVLMGLHVAEEVLDHVGAENALDVTPPDSAQRPDPNDLALEIRAALRDAASVEDLQLEVARQAGPLSQLREIDWDLADEVEQYAALLAAELDDPSET